MSCGYGIFKLISVRFVAGLYDLFLAANGHMGEFGNGNLLATYGENGDSGGLLPL